MAGTTLNNGRVKIREDGEVNRGTVRGRRDQIIDVSTSVTERMETGHGCWLENNGYSNWQRQKAKYYRYSHLKFKDGGTLKGAVYTKHKASGQFFF